MKDSNTKRAVKNIFFSVIVRIVTFAIGILIPRLVIVSYGSEINGLQQSIGNVFSYMSLMFAGAGTASIQGLYKPLAQGDRQGVSSVLVATRRYFRTMVRWFALGVIIFGALFPLVAKGSMGFLTIFGVVVLEGFSMVLTYYFTYTMQTLLTADGRDYVIQLIQFVIFLVGSAVKILLILAGIHIVLLQAVFLLVNLLKISIFQAYLRKNYSWLDWSAEPDPRPLKKKKNFLINGIAWTVFNSTDTLVISTFCGLALASVYAMYNLVFANLNLILTLFYSSIYFLLGQAYHKQREGYVKLHDGFESVVSGVTFACLAAAYVLILPFMKLYTQNVTDINYIDKWLPLLFCLVQILSNARLISGNLINLSNNPQLTNKASIIEVTVNLTLSVILVNVIGLHGVLIGTIVGLLFKTNYIIVISNKKILGRSPLRTYATLLCNCVLFAVVAIISDFVKLEINSYLEFVWIGAVVTVALLAVFLGVNFVVNPRAVKCCVYKFFHKEL